MDRIKKLCAYLDPCKLFADVGCDHGYCARYMLQNKMCEKAFISDISPKSLSKAEELLKDYVQNGTCVPVCCNGLEDIEQSVDLVLIAGMGGKEIISILKNSFIPERFVLQPMHNVREVREYLLDNNAEIIKDDVFLSERKYYFVLSGKRKGIKCEYTPSQLRFGKGDISGDLGKYLKSELAKKEKYLKANLSSASKMQISNEIQYITGVLNGEIR